MNILLSTFLSLPKSLYFNFKLLPFTQAIKIPILVNYKTKLGSLCGKIKIDILEFGIVKIGFGGSFGMGESNYVEVKGKLHFHGKASFSRGTRIVVCENATMEFGKDFRCNANCILNASKSIQIGNDVLFAWNITVLDGDGHSIKLIREDLQTNESKPVIMGDHIWVCPEVSILKGSKISNGSVVATKAIITRNINEENVLIGGNNKILKKDIRWEN